MADCGSDAPTLWPPHELPEVAARGKVEPVAVSRVATDRRKELGAFYTPPELVSALTDWAVRTKTDRVLEPASGEAAFLLAALRRLRTLGASDPAEAVLGVEIDAEALSATRRLLDSEHERCDLLRSDFFDLAPNDTGLFDAVVGNPPYIRYHLFRGDARRRGHDAAAAGGVELNGLASSWAPFVVHASRFLRDDGRLAFVLPAELLHVDYAKPIRSFLLERFGSITVVTFERAVFPGAMIDTVLLLAEGGTRRGLRVLRLRDETELADVVSAPFAMPSTERWSSLRTAGAGVSALEKLRAAGRLLRLGEIASVDIGCVTGANDFFVLTRTEARAQALPPRLFQRTIARPGQLRGAVLTDQDGQELVKKERCLLLTVTRPGIEQEQTALARYLRRGRRLGIPRAYKCRMRQPWYAVPGVRVPDAFLSYMSSKTPRVCMNTAGFSSTNLVHQVRFHLTAHAARAAYVALLHSSIALLSFELEGRSYGGGVLKLETKEAERAELPRLNGALAVEAASTLPDIDRALREHGAEAAAAIIDRVLLDAGVLTGVELDVVRATWRELQQRRVVRGRSNG